MAQICLKFLFFLSVCLPALLFRPLRRKRFIWCFLLCAIIGAVLPEFALLPFVYALMLGLCLLFSVYMPLAQGKTLGLCLCWGGCIPVLMVGRFLHSTAAVGLTSWFLPLPVLLVGLALGFGANWLSRAVPEDYVRLSEEQTLSLRPLLLIILALQLLLTLIGGRFPLGCTAASLILQILTLLILTLWHNMSLVIRHSQESSETGRQSIQALDRASRSSEAELLRRLTESNNKLQQVSLAYQKKDEAALSSLLSGQQDQGNISYSSFLLLDAILRHGAFEAKKAGMNPNFQLRLGDLHDFSLSNVGVFLNLMLSLMCEYHSGNPDTLRLRMQEWGDTLILTVGRRDALLSVPEDKINALRTLTEESLGWMEFTEKEKSICLSVVLFRPSAGV